MAEEIHRRQGIRDIPEICKKKGIKHVIIAPGSRNAPLIIAFAKYSDLLCLSITDERSAAYIAMGIAQYTGKPTALVCTSGTAVLNCSPAIAEAFYQEIPLIVFTADRPHEWIDQSDGQTIRQKNIFANYCKCSYELPGEIVTADDLWYSHRLLSQAIDFTTVEPRGPVHINIPLKEPLYTSLPDKASNCKIISTKAIETTSTQTSFQSYARKWKAAQRKMIVFGVSGLDSEMQSIANELSKRDDVLVVTENLSNLVGDRIISTPESFIASLNADEAKQIMPELLITVGHSIVSKKLKQYLRSGPSTEHWHIELQPRYIDTYKNLETIILSSPQLFLKEMLKEPAVKSSYAPVFLSKQKDLAKALPEYTQMIEHSDLKIFSELMKAIPSGSLLHLSNSTPIRYSQLFSTRKDITYFCNRGTSGIDGCMSTSIGSAIGSSKNTFLITGDLAFIYDSNAFWNQYVPVNFKVIVINNNGGNIFSMIDTSDEIRDIMPYFETPHSVNIEQMANAYGVEYFGASDFESFQFQLASFFQSTRTAVFEIKTDAVVNTRVFKDYFRYIKQFAQA
ncbi:MAG TPA: 2-succinyl-5-enolpyruvyl-6-hydroxy-3-cyclohexene-1-carboxylic-acid synthase [Bacteroidales bacterium]|nr:2-succinyl-5-enolpyruvyl-6-hydroxy-3-cyclohexene-1-carboxylic-acid synthase [Bacteroidales bacterium]